MEKLNEVAAFLDRNPGLADCVVQITYSEMYDIAEAFRALDKECNALADKGLELCREAANIYGKYNATQMPDMDLVDCQNIQELSDLAAKICTGRSS